MRDKREGYYVPIKRKDSDSRAASGGSDLLCLSYFGGGYLWLVLYRNVSVQNMKSELMDSFGIVLVIYMLILLFSDLEKNFIRRNLARDFWAALEASVIMIFVTALTIFLQHNNADASRGVYFCIAGMNLVLFFVAHAAIKYYLLHIYRNKRGTNQLFLVTTTDRVEGYACRDRECKRLGAPSDRHCDSRRQPDRNLV